MTLKRLVLFDIDGTLLWPDGAGRTSMRIALEQIYGTAGPIETYQFSGHTDRHTVATLLREAGLTPETIWDRFGQVGPAMEATLRQRVREKLHNIRPCPGALELVAALASREDVLAGLLTGNFRPSAVVKLTAAGFDPGLFRVGAYGDEAEARADLAPRVVERARELTGVSFKGPQIVTVGDTPADVLCGRGLGARSVAVMTGWTARADLESLHPDYLFDDLSHTQTVIAAIMAPLEED